MHFFPCRGSLSPARFRSRARLFWNQVTTCCFLKPKSLASHVPEDGDKCCLNLKLFSRVSHWNSENIVLLFALEGTANPSRGLPDLASDDFRELSSGSLLKKSSTNLSSLRRGGPLGCVHGECLPINSSKGEEGFPREFREDTTGLKALTELLFLLIV